MLQLLVVKLAFPEAPDIVAELVSDFLVADIPLMVAYRVGPVGSLSLLELIWSRDSRDKQRWTQGMTFDEHTDFHSCQFNYGLIYAIRRGDPEMLRWLVIRMPSWCAIDQQVEQTAASEGHIWALQALGEVQGGWDVQCFSKAAEGGRWDVVEWLSGRVSDEVRAEDNTAMMSAMNESNVERVQWLAARGFGAEFLFLKRCDKEQWRCRAEAIRYLLERGVGDVNILVDDGLCLAAEFGDLEFIKWMVANFVAPDDELTGGNTELSLRAVEKASRNGHIPVVQWLIAQLESASGGSNAIFAAVCAGDIVMVRWLHEQYFYKLGVELYQNCRDGYEEVSYADMDTAADKGHLEVLQFLHSVDLSLRSRQEPGLECTPAAMDDAATNGHLEIVKWLHFNRNEGCTTNAMDQAAGRGHLEVVKWLHENRLEGCTTAAMDNAATAEDQLEFRGCLTTRRISDSELEVSWEKKLAVLQFLHATRSEGCTTKAMDEAASAGRLEILKWLHENTPAGRTQKAVLAAAATGRLDILKWLHENSSTKNTDGELRRASRGGHLAAVKYLYARIDSDKSYPYLVLSQACQFGHVHLVDWIQPNCAEMSGFAYDAIKAKNRAEAFLHRERKVIQTYERQ